MVRPLETPRAAGVAGLAFAALFIVSVLLLRNHPAGDSTATEIRDFYVGQNAGRIALVGVYFAPFAGIAFLWFIAVIRNLIGDREDRFFAARHCTNHRCRDPTNPCPPKRGNSRGRT